MKRRFRRLIQIGKRVISRLSFLLKGLCKQLLNHRRLILAERLLHRFKHELWSGRRPLMSARQAQILLDLQKARNCRP